MKWGGRNGSKRYRCALCGHCFAVDHRRKRPPLWIPHIDGLSFRKLADQYQLTAMGACKAVSEELRRLPKNHELSKECCAAFSGILNVDGKYVAVQGFDKKIPFIYAIDYAAHDIVAGLLAGSESAAAYEALLSQLQDMQYPLRCAVGDDNGGLREALKKKYPSVPFQLCRTHYLENVRELLRVRTDVTHQSFFATLTALLKRTTPERLRGDLLRALERECRGDPLERAVVFDVWHHYGELFAFEGFSDHVPHSNNLIEAFNSHLNGRLKTIKGFESWETATLWCNAWMIRRRTKPFTDCEAPFKGLNGKCSIELTMKSGWTLEKICRLLYGK